MKIHIICDHIYPAKNDPTGKMAYLLGSCLAKDYEVHFYTKSSFKIQNKKNMIYHSFKCMYSYTRQDFNESKTNIKDSKRIISSLSFLFYWVLVKLKIIKYNDNKSFNQYIAKCCNSSANDLLIVVVGNYSLLSNDLNSLKCHKIVMATDSWYRCNKVVPDKLPDILSNYDKVFAFWPVCKKTNFCNNLFEFKYLIDNRNFVRKSLDVFAIRFSYFGSIGKTRDLDKFINYINLNPSSYVFNFYLTDFKNRQHPSNVSFRKAVTGMNYVKALENSDFLFLIDNEKDYELFIQSKIYEYASYGKPIVLFTDNSESPNAIELQRYDLALIVSYNENNFVEKINQFIYNFKGKVTDGSLYQYYPECNPDVFIKNNIKEIIKNDEK